MSTIKETMPTLMSDGGIFKIINPLSKRFGNISPVQMGIAYWSKAGMRTVNSLIHNFMSNGTLTDDGITIVGNILNEMYGDNWDRKWEAYGLSYNALENYNKTSEIISTDNGSGTNNNGATTSTTENKVSAFNSSTYQPGSQDVTTTNQYVNTNSYDKNNEVTERTSGNIGVTTSQQMLESELNLRKYNFIKEMFNDINDFITLQIYEPNAYESNDAIARLILEQSST